MLNKARYVMVGGFLGAGKTTAILELARRLTAQGVRVGLIANDQSVGLVDTAMFRSMGFATEEISGGCFCCKFDSLVEAARQLSATAAPDVLLAEPVGSCTDLVATVAVPLRQMYGSKYSVAPLTVMVDPLRLQGILGLNPAKVFSPKVQYIYLKQLEEAQIIAINKTDLLDEATLSQLRRTLQQQYPKAMIIDTSARSGQGIDAWLSMILNGSPTSGRMMAVDYDLYADGEARLGWLNVSAGLSGEEVDGNAWLKELIERVKARLLAQDIAIAHLKATLAPDQGTDLAVVNLVANELPPELAYRLVEPLTRGELTLNLRAEGAPEILERTVLGQLNEMGGEFTMAVSVRHSAAFRPPRPMPTHRVGHG